MDPIKIRFGTQPAGGAREIAPGQPLCILVLGDFRGAAHDARQTPQLRALRIDKDNFDERLRELAPQVAWLRQDGRLETLTLDSLDAFHPDELLRQSDYFEALRRSTPEADPRPVDVPPTSTPSSPMAPGQLLDHILELDSESTERDESSNDDQSRWQQVIQDLVQPALAHSRLEPQADQTAADERVGKALRDLLHEPAFQHLESLWSGLWWLIRRIDERHAAVYLVDCPRERLGQLVAEPALAKLLSSTAAESPGLLLCLESFSAEPPAVRLLGQLGQLAESLEMPCIAAAARELVGCDPERTTDDARDWQPLDHEALERWNQLRSQSAAQWLVLIWPRFLLRAPYGPATRPIESMEFHERAGDWRHEHYLWGHPALALAELAARSFAQSGAAMRLGEHTDISGLPVVIVDEDGDQLAQPCGEIIVGQREAEALGALGIMPLLSIRGRDAIRLAGFRTLALPSIPQE